MRMTQTNNPTSQPASLSKRMILGAGIGLLLIAFFLLTADEPDPAWGKFWMIRPLIITPFAGAMGGLCNHLLLRYYFLIGMNKTVAWIVSIIIFIIGLWMGIVLGLDGTLWD